MKVICSDCNKELVEFTNIFDKQMESIEAHQHYLAQYKEIIKQNDETINSYHSMNIAYLDKIKELTQELQRVNGELALKELESLNNSIEKGQYEYISNLS